MNYKMTVEIPIDTDSRVRPIEEIESFCREWLLQTIPYAKLISVEEVKP